MKRVKLPKSVKEIGCGAFRSSGLIKIELSNLSKIPEYAFSNCQLKEIIVPKSVKVIEKGAFFGDKLVKVTLKEGLESIEDSAFTKNEELVKIEIPESVKNIGDETFMDCISLSKVKLPSNLNKIAKGAFKNCKELTEINLSDSINIIGQEAFSNSGIEILVMPKKLLKIGKSAFKDNINLSRIVFSDNLKELGEGAFGGCSSLENIFVPSNVTKIGEGAFKDCSNLQKVILPNKLTTLPKELFICCSNLKEIILPPNLVIINENAFSNCESLSSIDLPKTVCHIGKEVFYGCDSLEEIYIPDNVSVIGERAFQSCRNLERVHMSEKVLSICDETFADCRSLKDINLPYNLMAIGFCAFKETNIKEMVIPNSVDFIQEMAFEDCKKLEKIVLPNSLTFLNASSFSGCSSLKEVIMPESLIRIDARAFENCKSLEKIVIPKNVEFIGNATFVGCENLIDIVMSENIKTIEDMAFRDTAIEKLNIPKTNESINFGAFWKCNNLKELTINGGKVNECLASVGKEIEIVKISENCKCMLTVTSPLAYIAKKNGYFILSKQKLFENSVSLARFGEDFNVGILMTLWEERDKFIKEISGQNGKNIYWLYSILHKNLDNKEFKEFFNTKNLKFFNDLCQNTNFLKESFFKLYYNLGGFLSESIETSISKSGQETKKLVNYSQIVSESIKKNLINNSYFNKHIFEICSDMELQGFKRGFTRFFINEENLRELLGEEIEKNGFISKCYNFFDEVQKTNTSHKGSQRQLSPTIRKFKEYFREKKFNGITEDTKIIADTIAPYFADQEDFVNAVSIENERKSAGTPTRILKEPLKEQDLFEKIDEYSNKIKNLCGITMKSLCDIANENFTFEWLEKNDPNNFLLGKYTSSCAHLEGMGYGIMRASIILPDVQNLVVRNKWGAIIAKATLYVNRNEGYGIVNTFEVEKSSFNKNDRKEIYEKLKLGISAFAEKYNKENPAKPLKIINVGIGINRLEDEVKQDKKESKITLKSINYQEYGREGKIYNGDTLEGQYTIWEDDENFEI